MSESKDKPAKPARGGPFRPKRLRTAIPRPQAEAPIPPPKEAGRIAKVMARAGVASRREAEAWIADGRVAVNGERISSPALNVTAKDRISIDGRPMPQKERTRLFLFNKPRGLVTTSADTHGRPTIFGALPDGLPRLISVGRLDLNTEGLLLLTNDGGLARALELPATGWLRRYRVRAYGTITQPQLDALQKGIVVDGVQYGSIEAALEREQGDNCWLTFAMREGKNREIRNVMRELGLQVNRLIRISYGPFQLADLPDGAIEEVKTRTLRDQLGERLSALSGADFSGPMAPGEGDDREEERVRGGRYELAGTREPRRPRGSGPPRATETRSADRPKAKTERTPARTPSPSRQKRSGHQPGALLSKHEFDQQRGARGGETAKTPPRHQRHRPHRGKASGPRPSRPKV